MESLTVVIIEDEEAHFQLMRRAIEKELPAVAVLHFDEGDAFLDALDGIQPDVLVVDYLMPGMTGIDLLEEMQRRGRDIPVIMTTGQGNEDVAVKAMRLGAWDYLVKSADFFRLLPATIEKVVRERDLKASLQESARLNELLLDSLPHPAMLIRRDRTILAANRRAREVGARIGGFCWRDFAHCQCIPETLKQHVEACPDGELPTGIHCTFCRADEALAKGEAMSDHEVHAFERTWDTWWIPIDSETFFHYATDVTVLKRSEQALKESEGQLKVLSSRLLTTQEEERRHLACELHDSVGSSLSAVKMSLENIVGRRGWDADVSRLLSTSISWIGHAIDEIRRIMTDLRPSMLDDLGIVATIQWFCRQFAATHPGIRLQRKIGVAEGEVPEDLKIIVFRIIQEALHNVVKYSSAEQVTLVFEVRDHRLELTIEDNGVGFDPAVARLRRSANGGLGLSSMRERAEFSGGVFSIESAWGRGTRIQVSWPYEEP